MSAGKSEEVPRRYTWQQVYLTNVHQQNFTPGAAAVFTFLVAVPELS